MDEIERNARLLCWAALLEVRAQLMHTIDYVVLAEIVDWSWESDQYTRPAKELAAAGLTIVPIEPRDEKIDEMAREIESEASGLLRDWNQCRAIARAAYRAGVALKREEVGD